MKEYKQKAIPKLPSERMKKYKIKFTSTVRLEITKIYMFPSIHHL